MATNDKRKTRRWRGVLLRLSLWLLAFVLAAEIGLRVFAAFFSPARVLGDLTRPDPACGYTFKPNLRHRFHEPRLRMDFVLDTNGQGHRGLESSDRQAYRVVVLGDSYTYGLGVASPETYPAVLEAKLAARLGRPVMVINAGVPRYELGNVIGFMRSRVPALRPDLVIVGVPTGETMGYVRRVTGSLFTNPAVVLGQVSFLWELLKGRWGVVSERSHGPITGGLQQLGDLCLRQGVPLLVVEITERPQTKHLLPEVDRHPEPYHAIPFDEDHIVRTRAAFDALQESPYLYEHHLNARGHVVVANLLVERLVRVVRPLPPAPEVAHRAAPAGRGAASP